MEVSCKNKIMFHHHCVPERHAFTQRVFCLMSCACVVKESRLDCKYETERSSPMVDSKADCALDNRDIMKPLPCLVKKLEAIIIVRAKAKRGIASIGRTKIQAIAIVNIVSAVPINKAAMKTMAP